MTDCGACVDVALRIAASKSHRIPCRGIRSLRAVAVDRELVDSTRAASAHNETSAHVAPKGCTGTVDVLRTNHIGSCEPSGCTFAANTVNKIIRIAIQGFSAFERATFESFFRLSKRRTPAYELSATLQDSEYVIADADDRDSLMQVDAAGKRAQAVAIGSRSQDGVAAQLPRPINLMAVVKLLDSLPREGGSPGSAASVREPVTPTPPAEPATARRGLAPLSSTATGSSSISMPARPAPAPAVAPAPAAVRPPAPAAAEPVTARLDHILVVDDSDIALRFMAGLLERFGFVVHLARSGEQALERTARQHFSFVFMDVNMPGLDGFKTCKTIKRRDYPAGAEPPTIVMLTSRDTAIDKLRGTMAGCDAYLTKPLEEAELLKVIGDREVRQSSFADTARAGAPS